MTHAVVSSGFKSESDCLVEHFKVAEIDAVTSGCLFSQVLVYTSFIVILAVIAARFVLALYFTYFVGWRLGNSTAARDMKRRQQEFGRAGEARPEGLVTGPGVHKKKAQAETDSDDIRLTNSRKSVFGGSSSASNTDSREVAKRKERERDLAEPSRRWSANFGFMDLEAGGRQISKQSKAMLDDPNLMHCLVMVPCYSEGQASLKATLNSVAHSYYPGTHKVLFVIADGIVKGKENDKSTPDILIDMIEVDPRFRNEDPRWGNEPPAYSYVAVADGVNRKNYAKIFAGWYKYDLEEGPTVGDRRKTRKSKKAQERQEAETGDDDSSPAYLRTLRQRKQGRVPMLLIVKCGNEEEQGSAKPGNRGKRDSQLILMNFLSKVIFDDRMTELEFDIFFKLFTISGVNPEKYECVLMVDADTRIYPDSITHMVACLLKDDRIMGLCGETKISNKWDSWVTMIQVFEYFLAHHMAKAFESVFGGVTCLPGCFCMYRIKTPKGSSGHWVPILANPDIVEEYSENVVDTLHKKNLLLLGEDRFLTTMMLRAFPKRRMVFCPPAICKTVVPETFSVLLSQRRRWINSTIHNLMELMLFVIFMELVGTLVLPAAITFTFTLVFMYIFHVGDTLLPLILLLIILGLPAVLIVITANRLIYVFWMLVYLLSLPIWNFVLPLYAFWHFDDFSWGETRRVMGEVKGHDHSAKEGEFDGSGINMKRWSEWVQVRKRAHEAAEAAR
ncbi:Chitin synthase, class 3, partial [Cladochytrium tenue]